MKVLPSPGVLSDANLTTKQTGNLAADREPQTGAAVFAAGGSVRLLEGFEDDSLLLSGNADARIADREGNHFTGPVQRFEMIGFIRRRRSDRENDLALFGKLKRIRKQVHEYLLQSLVVSANRRRQLLVSLNLETRGSCPARVDGSCAPICSAISATETSETSMPIIPDSIFDKSRMSLIKESRSDPEE